MPPATKDGVFISFNKLSYTFCSPLHVAYCIRKSKSISSHASRTNMNKICFPSFLFLPPFQPFFYLSCFVTDNDFLNLLNSLALSTHYRQQNIFDFIALVFRWFCGRDTCRYNKCTEWKRKKANKRWKKRVSSFL